MKFNVNDYVRVRLTDAGRAVHRESYEKLRRQFPSLPPYVPPGEDADGWSRRQMWELLQVFGPEMRLSGPLLFESTIELEIPRDACT